jgi:sugar lactone lactonase YvrE
MLKRILIAVVLVLVMVAPAALYAQEDEMPEIVLAERPGYHPEGIDWDAEHGHFVTGSITEGGVFTVADDGTVERLAEGVEGLASIGVHIDAERDRVLVAMSDFAATSDPEAKGTAALGAYDLETGEELFFVDLSDLHDGRNFANDVTVDAEGNAYLTNSFAGVIFKVDSEGNGEVFLASDDLAVQGFGLNGIDYSPDGDYLLAAVTGSQSLYKIPVDDPEAFSKVELAQPFGADGMVLYTDGRLYAVANTGGDANDVIVVESMDHWATAQIASDQPTDATGNATTLAMRDDAAYVVHAHFGGMGSEPPVGAFEIVKFTFDLME